MTYCFSTDDTIKEFLDTFFSEPLDMQRKMFSYPVVIKKGTELYRIRRDDGSDLLSPNAWGLAPKDKVKLGRFNRANEPLLYVSTDNIILGRELRLEDDEVYYEAKYICKEDFSVGTLLSTNGIISILLHKISMSIENDSCLYDNELEDLKSLLEIEKIENRVYNINNNFSSPFCIHKYLNNLYDYTNKIGLAAMNENGLRYASVYTPFEMVGMNPIMTFNGPNNGNIVLTGKGMKNIELVNVEKKKYVREVDLSMIFRGMREGYIYLESPEGVEMKRKVENGEKVVSDDDYYGALNYMYENNILIDI